MNLPRLFKPLVMLSAIAAELQIPQILCHRDAGLLSAYGIGLADVTRHRVVGVYQTYSAATVAALEDCFARMAADATRMAMQVAHDVSREVKREAERAAKEAAASETEVTPPTVPRAPRTPRAPMPPITGGKIVTGTLNGGGVDIKVSTMNGEITLRQSK